MPPRKSRKTVSTEMPVLFLASLSLTGWNMMIFYMLRPDFMIQCVLVYSTETLPVLVFLMTHMFAEHPYPVLDFPSLLGPLLVLPTVRL